MTITMTEVQIEELVEVPKGLLEIAAAINRAVERLLRLTGDLISPASPDPEEHLNERRGHG
jgi:hypothetical protein